MKLSLDEFDPELCLFCGQVFRFRRTDFGFEGVDGSNFYRIGFDGSLLPPLIEPFLQCDLTLKGSEQQSLGLSEAIPQVHEPNPERPEGVPQSPDPAYASLLRLEVDYDELWTRLAKLGPELLPFRRKGHRMLRPSDPIETFFCFLCSSNNNIKRITQMIDKLASFGEPFPGSDFRRFPSAQTLAGVGEPRLREMGFGYRARSISRAATKLANDPNWFEKLKAASFEEAIGQLRELDGVGPKLADCIALFALDHGEAVPVDTHLWQAFCRVYRPDWATVTLTEKRMRETGDFMRDRFGNLAGFAHHVLFVDNLRR
ncbi:MAG: hypothetical protein ABL962_05845 [Fimbriimonadaceae bacterium]